MSERHARARQGVASRTKAFQEFAVLAVQVSSEGGGHDESGSVVPDVGKPGIGFISAYNGNRGCNTGRGFIILTIDPCFLVRAGYNPAYKKGA